MTACTNHGGKARRVVTAALVGVLSLGVAPAVALASPAGSDQVTTLTSSGESAFQRGTVDLEGSDVKSSSDGFYAIAHKDATPLDVYASKVKPLGKGAIDVTDEEHFKQTIYVADAEGNATSETVEKIVKPGKYVIAVTALDGQYAGGTASVVLDVKAASLDNLDWFDASSESTSDQKLTYTGSTLEVGFQSDNVAFTEGEDYTVRILKKGTDNVPDAEVAEVKFNVSEFYMNLATVDVDDVIGSNTKPAHPTRVYYVDATGSVAELDPSLVDLAFVGGATGPAAGSDLFDKVGGYNFSVGYDRANSNIVNSYAGTKLVNKVAKKADFKYDGKDVQDSYHITKNDGEKFDTSKLTAYNGKEDLASKGFSFKAYNANGADVTSRLVSNYVGTYTVVASVDASQNNWQAGGSVTFTVTIVLDSIDADANVYVTRKSDGETVTSVSKTYDGTPIVASDFVAQAFDDDDNLLADSSTKKNLELALYDAEGNKVSQALDAGEYTLKVSSQHYELTGTTEIPVTIEKADLSKLSIFALSDHYGTKYLDQKDSGSYSWTDLDIRYDTKVADSDNNDKKDDAEGWDIISWFKGNDLNSFLSCERYDSEKAEWVEVPTHELGKTEGLHRITLSGNADLAKNFVFANSDNTTTVEFFVRDAGKLVFADVAPDQWYVDPVFSAYANKIMNGYGSATAKLFGPNNEITRGEVACVLFNMAGGSVDETDDWYSDLMGWKSFDDVDGTQYYGEAIAWCKKTGVVNGYADGTFKPEQQITREELACMLANYAKVVDQKDVSVDASEVLSDFADGSQVSSWAEGGVAWAVENGVMGNGGFLAPTADITRAETAAMAVNYRFGE